MESIMLVLKKHISLFLKFIVHFDKFYSVLIIFHQ